MEEEEPGLEEAPKDKKEKKSKKEKPMDEEDIKVPKEKKEKKEKKLKKEKPADEEEPCLDETTQTSKKEKTPRQEPVASEPGSDVVMREVVDLDSPEEEYEDSQLDTPKRMALNLMRAEDWERIKKRQAGANQEETPGDTDIDETDSEPKKKEK